MRFSDTQVKLFCIVKCLSCLKWISYPSVRWNHILKLGPQLFLLLVLLLLYQVIKLFFIDIFYSWLSFDLYNTICLVDFIQTGSFHISDILRNIILQVPLFWESLAKTNGGMYNINSFLCFVCLRSSILNFGARCIPLSIYDGEKIPQRIVN